jgi:hypothetical protein
MTVGLIAVWSAFRNIRFWEEKATAVMDDAARHPRTMKIETADPSLRMTFEMD